MSDVPTAPDRYVVSAATNVLRLLEGLGQLGSISLSQAAEAARVPSSTAYRLLVTMEALGFVQRIGKRGYRVGPAALRLARELEAQSDLLTASQDIARDLGRLAGESVRLALLGDGALTMVYGLDGTDEVWADRRDQMTINVHASAMGKAVAAYLDPTRLAALLGPEPYKRLTSRTLTTWRQLQPRLDETRARGYALDIEESADNVSCVARPIFRDDEVIGAISLEGASEHFGEDRLPGLEDLVRQSADKITGRLTRIRLRELAAE
jgi:DNA-binding IclR family transcriptional regulator